MQYAFQTNGALFLVMDFVNGGELFGHLKREGKFSESDARLWAAEILLALEYLHTMGVCLCVCMYVYIIFLCIGRALVGGRDTSCFGEPARNGCVYMLIYIYIYIYI